MNVFHFWLSMSGSKGHLIISLVFNYEPQQMKAHGVYLYCDAVTATYVCASLFRESRDGSTPLWGLYLRRLSTEGGGHITGLRVARRCEM